MAKRFYSDFTNLRNEDFTIEIWDTEFAGTATTFNPGADGFSLSYKGESQERTGTILATECAVQFRIETADHETFLTDIIASKESRFTMRITKGSTPALFWVGIVITDIGGYDEAYRPFFTIKAVDGLGLLKDREYKDGANFYSGKQSVKDHLINVLTHLEYVDTHFAVSDRFLRVAVDWWEETMTNNTTNDPLALTYLDHAVWIEYEKNVAKALSCYEVLDNILRCFGARITMHEGVFWIEQITYRTASTIVLRSYDKAGAYLSSNNFSTQNTINQTATGALLTGGVYEFFAPLSKAEHTFGIRLRQNHLAGQSFNSGVTTNVTVNKPIEANSGATTLRLTGNITLSLFNQSYTGNATIPRFALFKCTLKIGAYYLKRTYTVQNYQVIFGAMSWETTASNFYLSVEMPNGVPASGSNQTYNYSQFQDITTPPLPAGADSFQFGMIWDLITQADITQFLRSFNLLSQWLEPYSYGNPDYNDDEWHYETLNPDVENTLVHSTESRVGNSTDPNAIGALWVKPSSTYILADDWGDGTDTPDRDIEKLNIQLVLGGQQKPIRRLSGILFGPLTLLGRVVWQSANWLLLGGTYNAANAQMQGEWFELDYDGAGLSTSGPIKRRRPGLPGQPEFPGSGNDTGKPPYKTQSAPPGTLLYPVAATKTLNQLSAGAITNVDITDILAAGDFYDGDTIVVLNPITGNFDELEVTVTSAGGDDFITVTGTLTGDYPPDSPIIKKPLIGRPQVFGAGLANRLAYWISENELNDLDAGTDGQVLVSNGTGAAPSWQNLAVSPMSAEYKWRTSAYAAASDPGSGYVAVDNDTPGSAANVVISKTTNNGVDVSAVIAQLRQGDAIRIQEQDNNANWIRYDVDADPVAQGSTHFSIAVTPAAGQGTEPSNNAVVIVSLFLSGGTGGGGTVTSVALTMPTAIFDVAGSPITTSGTLAVTLDNQTANTIFAGPSSGGAAAPAFRALVAGDIPAVNASAITGLTDNQIVFGSATGGVEQSANLTYDGTTMDVTGKQTLTVGNTYSASQNFLRVSGTVTSNANSLTHRGLWIDPVFANSGAETGQGYYGASFEPSLSGSGKADVLAGFKATVTSASANLTTLYGAYSTISEGYDAGSLNNRIALRGEALFSGSGDYHTGYALYGNLLNSGSGRWNAGYGVSASVNNAKNAFGAELNITNNRGTANSQRGIRINNDVSGASVVVDSVYGIQLQSSAGSGGTITNYYGIQLNTIPSGATNVFFLHNANSGTKSYHLGNFGIGTGTSTPAQTLHVGGTARITGSDGTATTIMGRDADGDISAITVSTGLSLSGNVLTATGGTNYQTLRDDGAAMTQRANANFVSGTDISFTLTDDAVNTETEIAATIVNNAVTDAKIRQSAGLSVVGRSANTTGNVADITGTDGQVLRVSGTALGFGTVATAGIANNAVTFAKMQAVSSNILLGNDATGTAVEEITLGATLAFSGAVLQTVAQTGDVTTSANSFATTIAANAVTDAKFRQSAGLSVVGRSANTTGNVADITGTDGQVLRVSGTALGFGTVATAGIADDAVTFAKIQNITSGKLLGRYSVGSGDMQEITVSTGLSLDGSGNLTATAGTNYQTLRDDGAAMTQRANANFVSGTDISFTLTDDAVNVETEIAATIVTNAVTDAKFRQSAGLSVVGRSANTTGNVADITAAADGNVLRRSGTTLGFGAISLASGNAVTGTLPVANGGTGATTLTSDSVLTGNGTSAIVAEANLTFNSSGQLTIGSGTPAAFLNVFSGALGSATEFMRMSGNISNNMIMLMSNANNATTAANTIFQIATGGSAAGDPCLQFTVSGATSHAFGVDNSDADKIKLTPGASLPGGTANRGLIVTNATTSLVGINRDAPLQAMDVNGFTRANGYTGVTSETISVTYGTGAGTGPSTVSLSGSSWAVVFSFTTGTSPTANGDIFTITLPYTCPGTIRAVWSPTNTNAATDITKFYQSTSGTTTFTVKANGTLSASTTYSFQFLIGSNQ